MVREWAGMGEYLILRGGFAGDLVEGQRVRRIFGESFLVSEKFRNFGELFVAFFAE